MQARTARRERRACPRESRLKPAGPPPPRVNVRATRRTPCLPISIMPGLDSAVPSGHGWAGASDPHPVLYQVLPEYAIPRAGDSDAAGLFIRRDFRVIGGVKTAVCMREGCRLLAMQTAVCTPGIVRERVHGRIPAPGRNRAWRPGFRPAGADLLVGPHGMRAGMPALPGMAKYAGCSMSYQAILTLVRPYATLTRFYGRGGETVGD
jgi:hypothetical protein